MNKYTKFLLLILNIMIFIAPTYVFAARTDIGQIDTNNQPWGGLGGFLTINSVIDRFVNFALLSSIVVFLLIFIWAAYTWLMAAGDKAAVETAKNRITSAAIGLLLLGISYAVLNIVRSITYDK